MQRRQHLGPAAADRHPDRLDHPGLPTGAPYKGPPGKDFAPFGVGLQLTENDPAKLQFGQEVELTMVPFITDDDSNDIITFAFQPVHR